MKEREWDKHGIKQEIVIDEIGLPYLGKRKTVEIPECRKSMFAHRFREADMEQRIIETDDAVDGQVYERKKSREEQENAQRSYSADIRLVPYDRTDSPKGFRTRLHPETVHRIHSGTPYFLATRNPFIPNWNVL